MNLFNFLESIKDYSSVTLYYGDRYTNSGLSKELCDEIRDELGNDKKYEIIQVIMTVSEEYDSTISVFLALDENCNILLNREFFRS